MAIAWEKAVFLDDNEGTMPSRVLHPVCVDLQPVGSPSAQGSTFYSASASESLRDAAGCRPYLIGHKT